MIKRLAGTVLVAATATTLMAAPAGAATAGASTSVTAATKATTATTSAQLIRTRIYFGRCKDTCSIKVRIKNRSGKRLYQVKLNARLKVNGRKAGSCYDYVGTIRPYGVRWASCTVRTATLTQMWNNTLDGYASFRPYASTYVSYRYYG
ncbi:hypothetical protein [Nonomuraea sp. NPDC049400]|uniref:hypothetical protein n=1 Tax=Nonomuraea sp. NPDC049400 TaxID=3364352 RepID=UPI0037B0D6B1